MWGVNTRFIKPGVPWKNGYCEGLNGKLRDDLLGREISYTLTETGVLVEQWRRHYNTERPHSRFGYRPTLARHFGRQCIRRVYDAGP